MRFCYAALLFSLLIAALTPAASAQVLRGTVADADGQPLPGASVAVVGSEGAGTTADATGRFTLRLPTLPATIEARFLGFEPQRLTLRSGDSLTHTFRLVRRAFKLDEIDVAGENRGVALMREVIRRKAARQVRLPATTTERYTRFTLRRRGEVVRVEEVLSDVYARAVKSDSVQPDSAGGRREIVLARQRRPAGRAFRYARVQATPDFYLDDEVRLDGFRFIGPTHPDALAVYDFRVGDRIEEDGRVFWEVAVRPRSPLASAFEGRLRVVDSLFVLAEAELRPSVTLDKEPPIEAWAATYRQTFAPTSLADSVWLPDRFEIAGRVEVGVPGARLPTVRYTQTSVATSRRRGAFGSDSLFATRATYVVPSGVYEGRGVYEAGRVLAPPDADEAAVLRRSTRPLRASLVPEGLLRNYVPLPVEEAPEAAPKTDALAPPLPRLAESVEGWYNRVHGAYLGVRPAFGLREGVAVRPRLGVATSTGQVDASLRADARLPIQIGPEALVARIEGGVATVPFEGSSVYTQALLSAPTYIGWADYHDYLRRTFASAEVSWQTERVRIAVGGRVEQHGALDNGTDYEGMFVGDGQRPNAQAEAGVLRSGSATVGIGPAPGWLARPSEVYAEVRGEVGTFDPEAASPFTVYRFDGAVGGRVATLFRRRPDPAALYVGVRAGWASETAPLQLRPRPETRAGALSGFGVFRTQPSPPQSAPRYVQLAWEHDFGRSLFEAVGLPVGVALTAGHVWRDGVSVHEGDAHEVGVSLVRPWGFPLRIDSAWRLDAPGWFVGVGVAR